MTNSPKEISELVIQQGIKKANKKSYKTFLLGLMGGLFISLGAIGSIAMYAYCSDKGLGKFLAGTVFSVALMFVVLAGGEFFTGNNLITLGYFEKKYDLKKVLNNFLWVFLGNFVGCITMVFIAFWAGSFGKITGGAGGHHSMADIITHVAEVKAGYTFLQAFMLSILCNLLVAGAVWMQNSSKEVAGKVLTMYFPILAFIVGGFEHVVANMFYIPMGMILGANVTVTQFLANLLPVGLGNVVAGSLILPVAYYFIYRKN